MQCKALIGAILAVGAIGTAQAVIITTISPTYNSFGPLPEASFNGSGIPNDAVAIANDGDRVVLGLTAHQRYGAPAVTNNGAGVFSAQAGVSADAPSPADPYALWNFAYYIGGTDISSLSFQLLYDFDAGAGTDVAAHGVITIPGAALTAQLSQNSWNLGMDFLASSVPGLVAPGGAFDPNAVGEYSFQLTAFNDSGAMVATTAILVNVNSVPEPGALALAGLALLGVFGARRRR